MKRLLVLCACLMGLPLPGLAANAIDHGRFHGIQIQMPAHDAAGVALVLRDGPEPADALARRTRFLLDRGVMVVDVPMAQVYDSLEHETARCTHPDGDLENLSHFAQALKKLPTYHAPVLIGVGARSAQFAYAMLAQAPSGTFAGAISEGFCPRLDMSKPWCKGDRLVLSVVRGGGFDLQPTRDLEQPWVVIAQDKPACPAMVTGKFVAAIPKAQMLHVAGDGEHRFEAAWAEVEAAALQRLPPSPGDLADLPLIELPVQKSAPLFAVLLTGDGGWAGLDKDVAKALNDQGIPVVGLDSLRYFWTARTPDATANDVGRIIRYYLNAWHKQDVILAGYSQGADVLPFVVTRLMPEALARVRLVALMGMERTADFEFHLTSWVMDGNTGLPIKPELERFKSVPTLCVYGSEESGSLCPELDARRFDRVELPGGHHFSGDYAQLAKLIIARASKGR